MMPDNVNALEHGQQDHSRQYSHKDSGAGHLEGNFQDNGPHLLSDGAPGDAPVNIWKILNIFKKYWWVIAISTTIVMGLTALAVFRITPVYMASSVLEVKQQERQLFNASQVDNFIDGKEFFNTQIELLKSTTLASNVIDSLDLMSDGEFATLEGETRENKKRRVLRAFSSRLRVAPVGRSRLVRVSYSHTNPATAARIVNAVIDTFISYNLERKYNDTSFARDFIEDRLRSTKEILEKSERNLMQYAADNDFIAVRDEQGNATPGYLDEVALVSLATELTLARTNRAAFEKRYNLALENPTVPVVQTAGALVTLKDQHVTLRAEYIQKLAVYKPEFPEMVELKSRIDYLKEKIIAESENVENTVLLDLKTQYEVALSRELDLQDRVNVLKDSIMSIRNKSVDYTILEREVETNRTQYDALLQRMKEVSISDDIGSNLISLVDRAQIPSSPFKPNKRLALILAGLLGGALGVGMVFAREIIDDRINTPDDIKDKLGSAVMGVIPLTRDTNNISDMLNDSQSSLAEAYASLRINLQFTGPNGGPKVIHVTSTRSGEGKSVSALGIALRFAGLNEKVLLIDADLRLPSFGKGARNTIGLSGLLTSGEDPKDHIIKSKYGNLDLLPSGPTVPNPSEILSTYRLEEILNYARQNYTYVIVDGPPVIGLADAPILATKCDASLFVVQHAFMRTPAVKMSIERLMVRGVKLLGVLLTKYKAPSAGYLNYYNYSYGEDSSQYGTKNTGKKTKVARQKQYIDIL